jgi:hypothetical protein
LCLGDEKFVFLICEILTLVCVQVDVVTVNLGGSSDWGVTVAALDTNLHFVVLESHEWERLGPILTKEEGNHEVVTTVVRLFVLVVTAHEALAVLSRKKWVVTP